MGNNRLTFCDFNNNGIIEISDDPNTPTNELEITQETHYYPFGMEQNGNWYATVTPDNQKLYNGKEFNRDWDINLYDYGARWYDPALGRWTSVDPLAEVYYSYSPYNYVLNHPTGMIDPNGMFAWDPSYPTAQPDWMQEGYKPNRNKAPMDNFELERLGTVFANNGGKGDPDNGYVRDEDGNLHQVNNDGGDDIHYIYEGTVLKDEQGTVAGIIYDRSKIEELVHVNGYSSIDKWAKMNGENDWAGLLAGSMTVGLGFTYQGIGTTIQRFGLPRINPWVLGVSFIGSSWSKQVQVHRKWANSLTPKGKEAARQNHQRGVEMIEQYYGDPEGRH